MSGVLPLQSEMGELQLEYVFVEYDGPRLFSCRNEDDQHFLALFVEDSENVETYLFSRVCKFQIRSLRHNAATIAEVLLSTTLPHVWLVTNSLTSPVGNVERLPLEDIPELWLPAKELGSAMPFDLPLPDGLRTYGERETLQITVEWPERRSREGIQGVGLRLELAGETVWPTPDASAWPKIDPFRALTRLQDLLYIARWEESIPLGLSPGRLTQMRSELNEIAYESASPSLLSTFNTEFSSFVTRHDLSSLLEASVPSVALLREGCLIWISTANAAHKLLYTRVEAGLRRFGNDLADYLEGTLTWADVRELLERWDTDSDADHHATLSLATGLSPEMFDAVVQEMEEETASLAFRTPFDNEVLAAARMSNALSSGSIARVVDAVMTIAHKQHSKLDAISDAIAYSYAASMLPFEQGIEAARAFRKILGFTDNMPIDPSMILTTLSIDIREIELDPAIDALSAWGPLHGPEVLVNTAGRHAQGKAGRNSTIAHEIAHLLLDRDGALPLVDVVGGIVNRAVEARARAFAAELLMPQVIAGRSFLANEDSANETVSELADRYGVSREVVAWQVRNSGVSISPKTRAILRTFVSRPAAF